MQSTTKKKVPLTYELPRRDWHQLPSGLWSSVEWTIKTRAEAELHRYKLVPA